VTRRRREIACSNSGTGIPEGMAVQAAFHTAPAPERTMEMRLGPTELLIILGLVVLLFGASRLPQLARSLGDSMKELEKATRELHEEDRLHEEETKPKPELTQALRELREEGEEPKPT
jgi:sec-independent protein translocase protein TatA